MFGLSWSSFIPTIVSGFAATFVMEMIGFWQPGLKIARIDGAKLLADNAKRHWLYGEFAHYMNGIALADAYTKWFERFVPVPAYFKGVLYGILTALVADGVVTPITDPRLGVFFSGTPRPSRLGRGSLIDHIFYGVTLALGCDTPKRPSL